MKIEPNLLLVLAVLLKTRSVSAAADVLGVSQPSVSRSLSRLRNDLKDPLLVRSGNTMVRTARGEQLAQRLTDWMAHTAEVLNEQQFDPPSIQRCFRIGSTDFGVQAVLKPALDTIRNEAPGIALEVVPLEWATQSALASGKVDLVISGLDNGAAKLHRHLLFRDSFGCLMGRDHVLAQGGAGEALTLSEYLAHPHLSMAVSDNDFDRIAQRLGRHASQRRAMLRIPYFSLSPELLDQQMLVTLPGRAAVYQAALHGLVQRPAPSELGGLDYWLLWHERSHLDPATAWLRSRVIEAATS